MKTTRSFSSALVILVAVVVAPRPSRACTTDAASADLVDPFALGEKAASFAVFQVTAAPGFTNEGHGKAGDVTLKLRSELIGQHAKSVTYSQDMTPCAGASAGTTVIAFFDAQNTMIGTTAPAYGKALRRWYIAKNRQATLVDMAGGSDKRIAASASLHLAAILPAWAIPPVRWKNTAAAAVAHANKMLPALAPKRIDIKTCKLSATRTTGRAAAQRIKNSLRPNETLLAGDPDHVSAAAWDVSCSTGFQSIDIYISGTNGQIVAAWEPPEG